MENTPDAEKVPVASDVHRNSSDLMPLLYCCTGIISLAGDDLENNFFVMLLVITVTVVVLLGLDPDDATAKDDDDGFTFFFMKPIASELGRWIVAVG